MIFFLNASNIGLHGRHIPFSNAKLREAEFADKTALYLHGDLDNLHKTEMALATFYKASGVLLIGTNTWHFGLGMKTLHYGICIHKFVGSYELPQFGI